MSAPDEFDPYIERLFGRAPAMADADVFVRRVEERLNTGTRFRTFALGAAGLVGGIIAVRETVAANLSFNLDETSAGATRLVDSGAAAAGQTQSVIQTSLAGFGLDSLDVAGGALMGAQMFWVTAAVLIAGATILVTRIVQDV